MLGLSVEFCEYDQQTNNSILIFRINAMHNVIREGFHQHNELAL